MLTRLFLGARSLCFMAGYVLATVIWGSVSLLLAWPLPYKLRFRFIIGIWTKMVLFWLRCSCGIRVRVDGLHNIPASACVVLCKHESTMETFVLQSVLVPITTVIKRELLRIPFFGWAFALTKPVAIDRSSPRSALKDVLAQGRARLADGAFVLMFPEGSRLSPGQLGKFYRSGAALAVGAEVPVLPVVHNSGRLWRARQFTKYPGTARFSIGAPIATTGKTDREVNELARAWMLEELTRLEEAPPDVRKARAID